MTVGLVLWFRARRPGTIAAILDCGAEHQQLGCMMASVKYQGYNGSIEVERDMLIVVHSGMAARVGGLATDQPRAIPLQAISGVAFKDASRLTNGWLTLGLSGAPVPDLGAGDAGSNTDTVMFRHKNRDGFQALHDWLGTVIEHNRTYGIDPLPLRSRPPAQLVLTGCRRSSRDWSKGPTRRGLMQTPA